MKWMDIDTAPKDGTEVLVWVKRAGVESFIVAHYTQGGGEDQPCFGPAWFYWTGNGFSELDYKPLYWHPLPSKPDGRGVGWMSDTERLNFLDSITGSYCDTVVIRDSSTGRGWRLYESTQPGAMESVRGAIDQYAKERQDAVNRVDRQTR